MSASDDVWILGIRMTKFGKHADKDTVDLAAEAATGALTDAGVTMADIGVIAAGNLMAANAGIGQQLQKQIGQTGIPVYNVANACATGATALREGWIAIKAGLFDTVLCIGVEKMAPGMIVKKKVDPAPGSLSTQIVPPISSVNRLLMIKPSPVPPNRRRTHAPQSGKQRHRRGNTVSSPGIRKGT